MTASHRLVILRSGASLGEWLDSFLRTLPSDLGHNATLVLPSHRVAHRLRRDASRAARYAILAGVRTCRPEELAADILAHAGVEADAGLTTLRTIALRALLQGAGDGNVPLVYLRPDRTTDVGSYAEAIGRTIDDLEAASLSPVDLRAAAEEAADAGVADPVLPARLRDIALLWEATDTRLLADNPRLYSPAGLMIDAAAELTRDPSLAAFLGDIAVVLPLRPTSTLLRLVAALRPRAVALLSGRPERRPALDLIERVGKALGLEPGLITEPPAASDREIGVLRSFLFAPPEELARSERPRSRGTDGTVTLEQHAGVQQEIDAAASWVIEEVTERCTPLEEIAVLVPSRDPLAGLLVAALERAGLSAYVAGGLPVTDSASGTLLLQLLLALRDGLESERTIALLPHLRIAGDDGERRHLTEAEAREVVYGCGVVGGTPGNPERGREWAPKVRGHQARLRELLARMTADPAESREDDPEKARWALARRDAERLAENVGRIVPAVEALTTLAGDVLDGALLPALWPRIVAFHREWCLSPPGPPDAVSLVDAEVRDMCAHRAGETLAGRDAVDYLVAALGALRHPHGRFGEPRVFVGTPADAAGLRFRAVRLIGVVEGAVPGGPREDPILPDAARAWLRAWARRPDCLLETSADRVLRETHEVFLGVTAAEQRVALSAPRQWIDDTERELAGLMLETAVALGRPDPGADRPEPVPSLGALRRLYVAPGNAARARWDDERPATALRCASPEGEGLHLPDWDSQRLEWDDVSGGPSPRRALHTATITTKLSRTTK